MLLGLVDMVSKKTFKYNSHNLIDLYLLIIGIQQAPAVGRAMMEMITESGFNSIDLSRLGFGRLIAEQPLYEQNIV